MQNSELNLTLLLLESVCTTTLALHRWHILRLAEVETYADINIYRIHILRNRNFLVEHSIASVDKVGTEEEIESRWVEVQRPTDYARMVSVEEGVAD